MIHYCTATSDTELNQILDLQKDNCIENLTNEERKEEGFITARHDLALLKAMNQPHQHILAKHHTNTSNNGDSNKGDRKDDDGQVVGYTLCLVRDFHLIDQAPYLKGLKRTLGTIHYKQRGLVKDLNYIVMGQVCISKTYRGQGIFGGLYNKMRQELLKHNFDFIITAISIHNPRSLRAHQKVGFEIIHTEGDWHVVLWDIQQEQQGPPPQQHKGEKDEDKDETEEKDKEGEEETPAKE